MDYLSVQDYDRIERAIAYLENNFRSQPDIKEVARHTGLSESHFQRLFRHWAGITPKRFIEVLTAAHARHLLERSAPLLEAAWSVGLSGSSRLHDLFVNLEGVTPGQIQRQGADLTLRYGFHDSPFGACLLAESPRGLSMLTFVDDDASAALAQLRGRWPEANLLANQRATAKTLARIVASLHTGPDQRLRLAVQGTNFQVRVWDALLRIPPGCLSTYEQLARAIGQPGAVRAVGTAVGANPVPLLIPCHRVIRKTGAFGQYSGGARRKRAILAYEAGGAQDRRR